MTAPIGAYILRSTDVQHFKDLWQHPDRLSVAVEANINWKRSNGLVFTLQIAEQLVRDDLLLRQWTVTLFTPMVLDVRAVCLMPTYTINVEASRAVGIAQEHPVDLGQVTLLTKMAVEWYKRRYLGFEFTGYAPPQEAIALQL